MESVTVSLDDLPIRADLRGQKPYGAPQAPLPVALNVNENTHPVPEDVANDIADAIAQALRDVNRYPDREHLALREALAAYLSRDVAPGQEPVTADQVARLTAARTAFDELAEVYEALRRMVERGYAVLK